MWLHYATCTVEINRDKSRHDVCRWWANWKTPSTNKIAILVSLRYGFPHTKPEISIMYNLRFCLHSAPRVSEDWSLITSFSGTREGAEGLGVHCLHKCSIAHRVRVWMASSWSHSLACGIYIWLLPLCQQQCMWRNYCICDVIIAYVISADTENIRCRQCKPYIWSEGELKHIIFYWLGMCKVPA